MTVLYQPPEPPHSSRRWRNVALTAVGIAAVVALAGVGIHSTRSGTHTTASTGGGTPNASSAAPTFPVPPVMPGVPQGGVNWIDGLPVGTGSPVPVTNTLGRLTPGEQFLATADGGKVCTIGVIVKDPEGKFHALTAWQCVGPVGSKVYTDGPMGRKEMGVVATPGSQTGFGNIAVEHYNAKVSTSGGTSGFDSGNIADPAKEAIGEVGELEVAGDKHITMKLVSKENDKLIYQVRDPDNPGAPGGAASGAPVIWAENDRSDQPVLIGIVTDGTDANHVVVSPAWATLHDNGLIPQ